MFSNISLLDVVYLGKRRDNSERFGEFGQFGGGSVLDIRFEVDVKTSSGRMDPPVGGIIVSDLRLLVLFSMVLLRGICRLQRKKLCPTLF